MSTDPAIQLESLSKVFKGGATALDGVSLTVESGGVFGFLGPNGAGKTTTLRILTGLARATSGRASILGLDVATQGRQVRPLIGFVPDDPGFYTWMTARELLLFVAGLFGISEKSARQRAAALLEMVGLATVKGRIGGYSRGMKQRLGFAQALINAPRVLLLDEPTSALDPIGRKDVLDAIASLKGKTTVFFSSHILSDVERVCDTVAILDRGRVVAQAPVAELKRRGGPRTIIVELTDRSDLLEAALAGAPWLQAVDDSGEGLRLTVTNLAAAEAEVPRAIAEAGLSLHRFEVVEPSLEQVFVDLVEGGPAS